MNLSKKFLLLYLALLSVGALISGTAQWMNYVHARKDLTHAVAEREARRMVLFLQQERDRLTERAETWNGFPAKGDLKGRLSAAALLDAKGEAVRVMRRDGGGAERYSLRPEEKRMIGRMLRSKRFWLLDLEEGAVVVAVLGRSPEGTVALFERETPARFRSAGISLKAEKTGPAPAHAEKLGDLDGFSFSHVEINGLVRTVLYVDKKGALRPFGIESEFSARRAFETLWFNAFVNFLTVLAAMSLLFAAVYFLAFLPFVKKLIRLGNEMRHVAEGREERLPVFAEEELKRLVASIVDAARHIRQQKEMLSWILDHVPAGILIYREKVVYANRYACEHLGYTLEEIKEMAPTDFLASDDPKKRAMIETRIQMRLRGELGATAYEIDIRGKERVMPHYILSDTILIDDKPCGIVTFIDLTEIRRAESELQIISNHLPMFAYHVIGPYHNQRFIYASRAVETLMGYPREEVLKTPQWWVRHIHPDDRAAVLERQAILEKEGRLNHRYRFIKKDGSYLWLEDYVVALNKEAESWELVGFYRDVTREMIWHFAHKALAEANERMMLASSEEALWKGLCEVLVESGFCVYAWVGRCNERRSRIEPIEHYPKENRCVFSTVFPLETKTPEHAAFSVDASREPWGVAVNPDTRKSAKHSLLKEKMLKEGFLSSVSIRVELGEERFVVLSLYADLPEWFDDSSVRLLSSLAKNIGMAVDDLRAKSKLEYLGYYQLKTGLPNENALSARLAGLDDEAVLAVMNLHNFSLVNLNFGFEIGDEVLRAAADIIASLLKKGDELYHLGGDKFALLSHRKDVESVERLLQRVQRKFLRETEVDGFSIPLFVQSGLALYPTHCGEPKQLKEKAMSALSFCRGPSDIVRFEKWMEERSKERLYLVRNLKEAIEKRSFTFRYQPIVRAEDGKPQKCELLIRLDDDQGKTLPTDLMIAVAEDLGMIGDITRIVIDEAFSRQAAWRREGIDVNIAVNIAAADIENPAFVTFLQKRLEEYGVEASTFTLEFTERVAIDLSESVRGFIDRMKRLGFKIGIDDFGIAHSSLHEISRIYFDLLKIDCSFIEKIGNKRNDEVIRLIIRMAHELEAITVAEGVEEAKQAEWLKAQGCDFMQGYLYSRPLDAEGFAAWYNARQKEGDKR
ncbi:MAG: EAL domain-containing protein [Epsilonproteobacteria bacterium]|nr:EAL domain-containing protein [Campylobacterota bacterium]